IVGVLRGSTRRMPWKPGIGSNLLAPAVRWSGITARTPLLAGWNAPTGAMSVKRLYTTPIEDTTSLTSLTMLAASHTTWSPEMGWSRAGVTALTLAMIGRSEER